MALTATVKLGVNATQTSSVDLGTITFPLSYANSLSYTSGTGTGAADRMFTDTRTLPASANEDIDLSGSLTDAFGVTVTFARIKAVIVVADSANTNSVNVIRPASNGVPLFLAASDGIQLAAGEMFMWAGNGATGKAVTASTADLINIANSAAGTSVTYTIIVIGASA